MVPYTNRKLKPKFIKKRKTCIFVGYATSHTGDVYWMLNMNRNKIIVSRDVIWFNKSYTDRDKDIEVKT